LAEHRRRVAARFEASAARWRKIYQQDGVYEVIHQLRGDLVLALAEKLRLPAQAHVLEVGCGAGFATVELAQRGYTVNAIDIASRMIALTRRLAVETGVQDRVITSIGDVHSLPFPDNAFSLAIAVGVTPFLPDVKGPFQEIARVLKPEGYLIVNADNRWRLAHLLDPRLFPAFESTRWRIRRVLERLGLAKAQPQRLRLRNYSLQEFDASLSAAGLDKLEGRTIGFGPFTLFNRALLPDLAGVKVHHKLQALANRGIPLLRSGGAQYIVLAKKKQGIRRSLTDVATSRLGAGYPSVSATNLSRPGACL
jgi:ubiquinone/menaquinone biosynthesis C-methylase UbiE